ncbi:MAG: ATP synthase F0 subunit C [Eubacteriales bacterium]|nr:ATP synthase F0 subunit C [Eubacteriales bacterium]
MGLIAIGAGICMGLAALGVALGQGILANGAMNGMARQPESSGKIQGSMIIAMAIMETALVLAFVIAIMIVSKM